jgi:hypothetical protein
MYHVWWECDMYILQAKYIIQALYTTLRHFIHFNILAEYVMNRL